MKKLDKNKIYQRIGQVVVYCTGYMAFLGFCYWGFLQRLNILKRKEMKENGFTRILQRTK